ncbi:MAG: helix-turn-helix domain-containing protein [Bacteroidetes bacterium]|nr:MAG: helix-turn-helix domain-containing protein [Bacteroidota bacterium]
MSADPDNEYFSDGITEEIINALTMVEGLKVIARTSSFAFKHKNIDVRTIGRQLGVSMILEGSVRKAKSQVRITAQLIETHGGVHLWSKNFDRELQDIFALQDEISLLIAEQIREHFGHIDIQDHLIGTPTTNIEAYKLYLKGRYHQLKWNANDIAQGISYYEQSISQDPAFALPYFGAALSYGISASWGFIPYEQGIQRAAELTDRGLELNDQAYIGQFAQGTIYFWGKWDFRNGHKYLSQAMATNPSFTDAEEGLAELYTAIGAFEAALRHTEHILSINPLSPNHYYTQANIYYLCGDYATAISSLETALQLDPKFALATEMIALCYIQLQEYEKLQQFLDQHPQAQHPSKCRALFQLMYPHMKEVDVDLSAVRTEVKEDHAASLIAWNLYLQVYLGQHELVLDILEKRLEMKTGQLINFKHDPFFKPLHSYERFQKMVARIFDPSRLPEIGSPTIITASSPRAVIPEHEVKSYLSAIANSLERERLYLDTELSLKGLAQCIDLHPNKLSWLLNERIGKNFNEYINTYRLETFKTKALDPKNSHLTLLGLAYESGFNSKTVFNTFFKKMEGLTPSAWLKAQKQKK